MLALALVAFLLHNGIGSSVVLARIHALGVDCVDDLVYLEPEDLHDLEVSEAVKERLRSAIQELQSLLDLGEVD